MKNNLGIKELHIDKANYSPLATVKQEDNITMTLELYKNGVAFDISSQTVTLAAKRADKVIIEQIDGFTIDNNRLTIEFKNNINAKIGLVYLELNIKDTTGSMTTLDFYLKVNGKIMGEDSLDASNDIASLEKIQQDFIDSSNTLLEAVTENENTRVQAEKNRKNDEETRNRSETSRTNAETKRVEAEKTRVNQENLRVAAEEERVAAERIRDEKVEKINSQCTKNTKEIDDSKGEYDTLKARLDRENEKVYETINSKDFLPFEGENVTVEHSKVGFTKDMLIEGRTLQNISPVTFSTQDKSQFVNLNNQYIFEEGYLTVTVDGQQGWLNAFSKPIDLIKANTIYTLIIDVKENTLNKDFVVVSIDTDNPPFTGQYAVRSGEKGIVTKKLLTKADLGVSTVGIRSYMPPNTTGIIKLRYMLLEGDWTNKEIPPYFEGIKSVGEKEGKINILSNGKNIFNGHFTDGGIGENGEEIPNPTDQRSDFILVKPDTKYVCSNGVEAFNRHYAYYDSNKKFIKRDINIAWATTPNNTKYMRFWGTKARNANQIEEGTRYTGYTQYQEDKKEILVPIEDGLKGLTNGICDTLESRKAGVYCIEKVKKYSLSNYIDGNWYNDSNHNKTMLFYIALPNLKASSDTLSNNFTTDNRLWSSDTEGITVDGSKVLQVRILRSKLDTQDVEGFKAWLQAHPTVVYCEIEEQIETKLAVSSLNLETFKNKTQVFSENSISPNFKFKAPVDVPATLSSLRSANTMLIAQNTELQAKNEQLEEVNKKQTTKIIELDDTTSFLIEDALTRKLNN